MDGGLPGAAFGVECGFKSGGVDETMSFSRSHIFAEPRRPLRNNGMKGTRKALSFFQTRTHPGTP